MTVPDDRYDDWHTPDGSRAEQATHVLAHLSDPHLTETGVRYNGVLDADAALDRAVGVLQEAASGGRRFDAVVLSGDLTDTGDLHAYRRLAGAVGSVQGPDHSPQLIFATGNHDVRVQFHRQLLDRDEAGPILQVHDIRGLRVIVLDSTVVGAGHGRLTDEHLDELRSELATAAPAGTILVLHHAPVPPPSPLLSYFALEATSRRALSAAIDGTDVRMILAGHHHLAQSAMLGPVPIAVAGSTAIRTDPLAPAGHERTWASGTFNVIEVYPDTIVASVIPVDGAAVVFDLDSAGCAAIIDAHPIPTGRGQGRRPSNEAVTR
jgi:3',5'-cyclic AMP phosphodiesterase CpdA